MFYGKGGLVERICNSCCCDRDIPNKSSAGQGITVICKFELCLYVKKTLAVPFLPATHGRKHGTKTFEVCKCHVSDTDEVSEIAEVLETDFLTAELWHKVSAEQDIRAAAASLLASVHKKSLK